MVTIKSKKEIEFMREACKVVALTHKAIEEAIKPGMTTADLDKIVVNNTYATNEVDEFIDKAPSLYNYCLRQDVSSILIVRVGLLDRTYGYLMCAEPYTRRIWQDDEEAMMYFLARTVAGYIMLSGEEL